VPRVLPSVYFVGHATVLIEIGGVRVLTDPVLRDRITFLHRIGGVVDPSAYEGVDLIAISHLHHDHCDLASLRLLPVGMPIVVPKGAGKFLQDNRFLNVIELGVGQTYALGSVTLTATSAEHDGHRKPFGPTADAVGYVLRSHEAAVYFAGDTDLTPTMRELRDQIDVALLPVWGWGPTLGSGHLTPETAAQAVRIIRPRCAVPVHWGTLFPYGISTFFRDRIEQPPLEFAKAVQRSGEGTKVLVVEPGNRVPLPP
jgi:L-ascorbate metabolism protein UlaG (beta-lactamase superfamily)